MRTLADAGVIAEALEILDGGRAEESAVVRIIAL